MWNVNSFSIHGWTKIFISRYIQGHFKLKNHSVKAHHNYYVTELDKERKKNDYLSFKELRKGNIEAMSQKLKSQKICIKEIKNGRFR